MEITGTVDAILKGKGHAVYSVAPDAFVFDAIEQLAAKNVGALMVMDGDSLVGIFSERDYTRKVALKGKSSKQVQVQEIMSHSLHTITPRHTVEECMRIMTDSRVRHLPVLEGDKVVGVVSIGNLVNWIISAQSAAIGHLEDYISGKYPG